jgi:midasin (ATPase involved in ribosome maturation)
LGKAVSLLDFISLSQGTYLASLAKFSYLTQRVFLYLIYQGFCGKDDQEQDQKEKEQDEKYLDGDGCGMGDGQGQNNVSNEIENEE